ncbi:hypothetical protein [Hwanghaeella sp.]|uniref:hypothetical protein n=1 Tax=Hwanghaeella sp. TaxID=2605943 RepID=UPI003CCBEEB8
MSGSEKNSVGGVLDMRRYRPWHWGLSVLYGLLMLASLPSALVALKLTPAEGTSEGLFFAMSLAIAAIPFTIAVCLTASWMYHKGGAQRAAFIPYAIPLINIAAALILRSLMMQSAG